MQLRLLTAAATIVALSAVGCGSSSPSTPSSAPSSTGTPTIVIASQNGTQAFNPNPATFAGQQVVFRNNDTVVHRVVLNDGSVDTGDIAPGTTSRAVIMPGTGTNYHCTIHPGMIGSVGTGSAPPPACVGDYCNPY